MRIFIDVYNGREKERTIEVRSEKQLEKVLRELDKQGYKYHGAEIVKHSTPLNGEIGICIKMVNEEPIIMEMIEDDITTMKADVEFWNAAVSEMMKKGKKEEMRKE
jgi:hypothetical protein